MKKHYLGDGVYVREGDNGLWIYLFDGYDEKSRIFLEWNTLASFELVLSTLRTRTETGDSDER